MTKTEKIVLLILLLAIIIIAVGYATIQNVILNITGSSVASPNQSNFTVKFIGEPTTEKKNVADSASASIIATIKDDTNGTITVTGLTAKGDTVTATYTVQNTSTDLSADLSVETSNNNKEYFSIETELGKTSLVARETTTLVVTVKMLKTPILAAESATIGVQLTAAPVQPGEEEISEGKSTGSEETTATPYLPTGFSKVAGTNLSTGLTIQDSSGNQYVWIEVPQTTEVYSTAGLSITTFTDEEYTKIENDLHTYTSVYRNGTSYTDTYYSDDATGLTSTQYTELKQKMLKSVYQNGGFYIGKYETGIEDTPKTSGSDSEAPTETPVIKQNAYPYNNVTCSQAQTLASGMESGEYTSSLMFGVQWDLVLKYLETKAVEQGTEKTTIQSAINTDSTNWGNYSNNLWNITNASSKYYTSYTWTSEAYGEKKSSSDILLSTGANETFSKQGIYDLAGNVWEWTIEYTSDTSNPCACRSGPYDIDGYIVPASYRVHGNTTTCSNNIGFRTALY